MRRRDGQILAAVILPLCACYEPAPPWTQLLSEQLIEVDVQVEGVGPHAADLSADLGRRRAEALPGDLVRLSPVLFGPEGPIDPPADAIWFQCGHEDEFCNEAWANEELGECPELAPAWLGDPSCELGVGGTPQVRVAAEDALGWAIGDFQGSHRPIGYVGGTSTVTSTECLSRLRAREDVEASFEGCVVGREWINFGPSWRLEEIRAELGYVPSLPQELLDQVADQPPDFAPSPRIVVEHDDGETQTLASGATVQVSEGRLGFRILFAPEDRQAPWGYVSGGGPHEVLQEPESYLVQWWSTGVLEPEDSLRETRYAEGESMGAHWEEGSEDMFVVFLVSEIRQRSGGVVWLRLTGG